MSLSTIPLGFGGARAKGRSAPDRSNDGALGGLCEDYEASSLPEAVQEWLQHSQIFQHRAGPRKVRICSIGTRTTSAANQHTQDANQLHELLRLIADQAESLTSPMSVDDWFRKCSVKEATKLEFQQPIQARYANSFVLESPIDFALNFSRSGPPIRVAGHPWMSIAGYSPNVTLNNAEVAALSPMAIFLDRQLNLYHNNNLKGLPFPDTPRLDVQELHREAFERIARIANVTPREYQLHYARYYVALTETTYGQQKPRPLLALAYSHKGSAIQITFSLV
jgi:hypothetical protein